MTSSKTVTSHLVFMVVFWCRRLRLLHTTDVRAYRAATGETHLGHDVTSCDQTTLSAGLTPVLEGPQCLRV
ncbi:hypothetical protein COCON_G00218220 [Conger conger]|uniref:Secreted protein n=1 Tax=Conger conger TaxID=82655 RepID=A0A9Q1CYS1_CONCO|nr:hypothetical protein COCON_G00218220 [Conger conger]